MWNSCTCAVISIFTDTATTQIYTLSLHDALPISRDALDGVLRRINAQSGGAAGVSGRLDAIRTKPREDVARQLPELAVRRCSRQPRGRPATSTVRAEVIAGLTGVEAVGGLRNARRRAVLFDSAAASMRLVLSSASA